MYEFFQSLLQSLLNSVVSLFGWLGDLLQSLWTGLKGFITALFQPLLWLVTGFTYLLGKCFDISVLIIQVMFGLFKVTGSIILGVFNTFSQLSGFTGNTDYYRLPAAYQGGWNAVGDFLYQTGFNSIAAVMAVFIWLMTAYAIIRIAGGER